MEEAGIGPAAPEVWGKILVAGEIPTKQNLASSGMKQKYDSEYSDQFKISSPSSLVFLLSHQDSYQSLKKRSSQRKLGKQKLSGYHRDCQAE